MAERDTAENKSEFTENEKLSESLTKLGQLQQVHSFKLNSITGGHFTLAATMTPTGKSSVQQTRPDSISKLAAGLTRTGHPCATNQKMR